jgi:hypothetical protein
MFLASHHSGNGHRLLCHRFSAQKLQSSSKNCFPRKTSTFFFPNIPSKLTKKILNSGHLEIKKVIFYLNFKSLPVPATLLVQVGFKPLILRLRVACFTTVQLLMACCLTLLTIFSLSPNASELCLLQVGFKPFISGSRVTCCTTVQLSLACYLTLCHFLSLPIPTTISLYKQDSNP